MAVKEIWKPIERFKGSYEVSNLGRIRSVDRLDRLGRFRKGTVLRMFPNKDGYLHTQVRFNGRPYSAVRAHTETSRAFLGPRPEGLEVNHKDGDKTNNAVSNLEYVTQNSNLAHAFRTGLRDGRGETNAWSKLKNSQVRCIRVLASGIPQVLISKMFHIGTSSVNGIVRGTSWRHVL